MSHRQFDNQLGSMAPPMAGLSRRKALKLLVRGAVGSLLAQAALEAAPVRGQDVYLPSLLNSTAPPLVGEDDLCIDDADCLSITALDFGWFRTHLLDEILPKWLLAVTNQGLFLPHFDRQWRPLNRNFGTLISQCRLL